MAKQNTIDLQWKIDANCNASPCESERKAAGARTMASNEKTMRRAMETMKNQDADLRAVVTPEDRQQRGARLAARRTEFVRGICG